MVQKIKTFNKKKSHGTNGTIGTIEGESAKVPKVPEQKFNNKKRLRSFFFVLSTTNYYLEVAKRIFLAFLGLRICFIPKKCVPLQAFTAKAFLYSHTSITQACID